MRLLRQKAPRNDMLLAYLPLIIEWIPGEGIEAAPNSAMRGEEIRWCKKRASAWCFWPTKIQSDRAMVVGLVQ